MAHVSPLPTSPYAVAALVSVVSIVAHATFVIAAVVYGFGHGAGAEHQEPDVEIEAPAIIDSDKEHEDVAPTDDPNLHAAPPSDVVAPNHDAVPHPSSLEHRAVASERPIVAPPSVLAAASDRPTFTIVVGQSDAASGASRADGTDDRSRAGHGSAGAPSSPASSPDGDDRIFTEKTVSQGARLISTLRPEYPASARAQGIEATVSLEIVVDPSGRVIDARVVRGAGYGFEDSALSALRSARFAPALRGDHPVRVRMRWSIDFRIE